MEERLDLIIRARVRAYQGLRTAWTDRLNHHIFTLIPSCDHWLAARRAFWNPVGPWLFLLKGRLSIDKFFYKMPSTFPPSKPDETFFPGPSKKSARAAG